MVARMLRKERIHYLASLVGAGFARVLDARDGWPGLMEIQIATSDWRPFEVHVGTIGPSTGRGRRSVEHRFGLIPSLLPVYAEMKAAGVTVDLHRIASVLDAAGLRAEDDLETPLERARRASSQLVRSSAFSRRVIEAYGGLCAMCDLDLGLVEGAHIYPAQAPGSTDEIWNGVALCSNHHSAFDKHLIKVDPATFQLDLHPKILANSGFNQACRIFVDSTRGQLRLPRERAAAPRGEMFERRYEFFNHKYGWA